MHVVGIDPSSTATGIVLLSVADERGSRVSVLERATLRPPMKVLSERCEFLCRQIRAVLGYWQDYHGIDLIVIEDPTDYPFAGQRTRNAGRAMAKVAAAFGSVYAAALSLPLQCEIVTVASQRWLPRQRGRRGSHFMPHKSARQWLRTLWPALEVCTDDETFAAGVALYAAVSLLPNAGKGATAS